MSEALHEGILELLSQDEDDFTAEEMDKGMELALQLCRTANLSERNHAIALSLRKLDDHSSSMYAHLPNRIAQLAVILLKV